MYALLHTHSLTSTQLNSTQLTEKYDVAWEHLEHAHSHLLASRDTTAASLAVIEERATQIKQVFTKSFFPPGVGSKSKAPVFIVGMMR